MTFREISRWLENPYLKTKEKLNMELQKFKQRITVKAINLILKGTIELCSHPLHATITYSHLLSPTVIHYLLLFSKTSSPPPSTHTYTHFRPLPSIFNLNHSTLNYTQPSLKLSHLHTLWPTLASFLIGLWQY